MKERITTAAILGIGAVIILLLSGVPLVMGLVTAALAVMGVFELLRTAGAKVSRVGVYISLGAAALIPLIPMGRYSEIMVFLFPAALALFFGLMAAFLQGRELPAVLVTVIGVVIAFFARGAVELRSVGLRYLIAALAVCVLTDCAAFFVGSSLGRHKLASRISPHKTVEGAAGGLVCAVGLVTLGGWIFCRDSVDYSQLLVWALTASVIAQFGDLSLSTVKRMAGVKDFGTLLPGHGGILDRFDSCLFVLPYTVLFVTFCGRFLG